MTRRTAPRTVRKEPTKIASVRIDVSQFDRAVTKAYEAQLSFSALVNLLVTAYNRGDIEVDVGHTSVKGS